MRRMRKLLQLVGEKCSVVCNTLSYEHRATGAALLRIALGTNMLVLYALHFRQRGFIWGDNGVLPRYVFDPYVGIRHSLSLYQLGKSDTLHEILFFGGMGATALFISGFAPRLMSVVFFIFTWSLYTRNEIILDGGDNLLILVAFFLMFVDTSRNPTNVPYEIRKNRFVALIHNFGVAAIVAQISILYFTSATAKIMGHKWQDGTAIYYVLRTSEFNLSPLTQIILHNAALCVVLTYSTIILQVAFPFLIWNKALKYPVILAAFTFHVAIAYFMGLVWFSLTLLSCEFILISDKVYEQLFSMLRTACMSMFNPSTPGVPLSPELSQARHEGVT